MPDSEEVTQIEGVPTADAAPVEGAPVADPASPESAQIADERLLAAHDLALSALREITPAATIGEPAGYSVEPDGVVSLRFQNLLPGYPGWFWTVSLARVEDEEPTVLEVELLPGESALLAPEWVPWAVRLAEYRAQQTTTAAAAEAEAAALEDESDDDTDDDVDDLDDLDASDFDADGSPILHAGDVDGVDIDELDEDAEDSDDSDDDGEDTEDSDSDDDEPEEESDDDESDDDEDDSD